MRRKRARRCSSQRPLHVPCGEQEGVHGQHAVPAVVDLLQAQEKGWYADWHLPRYRRQLEQHDPDEIETFDSTTLLDKLDSVETNLAAGTTAETTAVEAVVTAAQTVITNDVAKVKTDVKAMDAKVALESTAEKVKKDLDDTKDAVGDYGIAAVVLVAIMLVLGAVLSFSAAAKGAKRSSPSSSRVRGRQRYEESEGESST